MAGNKILDDCEPTSATSSAAGPSTRAPLRLRLHHLFAVTAVMAVMLTISNPRQVKGLDALPFIQIAVNALGVVYTILASVAITIVAYGIAWRRKGVTFFNQPGHWLLVTLTVNQLVHATLTSIARTWAAIEGETFEKFYSRSSVFGWSVWFVPTTLIFILDLYIGAKKCRELRWPRVFYSKAAAAIIPGFGEILVLLFLDRAVKGERPGRPRDQKSKIQRGYVQPIVSSTQLRPQCDMAHWYGVAFQYAWSGLVVLGIVAMILWICFRVMMR